MWALAKKTVCGGPSRRRAAAASNSTARCRVTSVIRTPKIESTPVGCSGVAATAMSDRIAAGVQDAARTSHRIGWWQSMRLRRSICPAAAEHAQGRAQQ